MSDKGDAVDLEAGDSKKNKVNPEVLEKLTRATAMVHASFGQVVLAMSSVPRYRNQSLADLSHLVIEPLIRDRIALAQPKAEEGNEKAALVPASIALWASVSAETDAKIREQVKAGAFPVRLKAEEWNNGDIVWLLDVIAPTQQMATAVLRNFNKIAQRDSIHIHPIIRGLVDPEVLGKLTPNTGHVDEQQSDASRTLN